MREDQYDDLDRAHSFDVECTSCGLSYSNLHGGPCPSCGSSSCSFDVADARAWTEYADRRRY